jgi:phage terminase large subunit-like protein
MRQAPHRRRWLDLLDGSLADARRTKRKGRLLLLAPRDHGKTELGISVALRQVCLNRNVRILWISEAAGVAEKRVRRLRALLTSERVVADWCSAPGLGCGPFRAGGDEKWTNTQIYVTRTLASVDPTIEAVGSGGAITGGHFDLILCDDLEDDRTTYTAGQREKTRLWWGGTVLPMLSRGGLLAVIGTRKHADDLYHHLKESPLWRTIEDPAIIKWPDGHRILTKPDPKTGRELVERVEVDGEAEVLWPEERPIEYLLGERYSMGSLLFAREFMHAVQDDSAAAFKMDWLEAAKRRGAHLSLGSVPNGLRGLEIVQGWDFALVTDAARATKQDSDYTVGVTWARDASGDRYLLGIQRMRGVTPARIRGEVMAEFQRYGGLGKVAAVAVERNAFGELHYMGLRQTTDLPIKPHLTTGAKKADPWEGVPSLGALFENGKVVLPSRTPEDRAAVDVLVNELWGLGREAHDDTVMALWIAECVLRKAFTHRVATGLVIHDSEGAHYDTPRVEAESMRAGQLWDGIQGMFPGLDFGDDEDD